MLIGRDDISNDVSTLGSCFSMFVYILAHFHFVLIGRNLKNPLKNDGEPQGNGIQIPEIVASSPSFSRPAARAPQRAWSQAMACQ